MTASRHFQLLSPPCLVPAPPNVRRTLGRTDPARETEHWPSDRPEADTRQCMAPIHEKVRGTKAWSGGGVSSRFTPPGGDPPATPGRRERGGKAPQRGRGPLGPRPPKRRPGDKPQSVTTIDLQSKKKYLFRCESPRRLASKPRAQTIHTPRNHEQRKSVVQRKDPTESSPNAEILDTL